MLMLRGTGKGLSIFILFFACLGLTRTIQADRLDIASFKEDVCWTVAIRLDGCEVIGFNLEYRKTHKNFYSLAMLGHFFSQDRKDSNGDPLLNSTTIAFGAGKKFHIGDEAKELDLEFEVLLKLQADDNNGNSNSNSGPEVRLRLNKGFARHWQTGFEITLQKFQNCSHPDCHGLRSEKPTMQNAFGALFIQRRFSKRLALTYKIFDLVDLPERDLYNGRDPESLGQLLAMNIYLN